jgi:hypothetical protein
MTAVAWHSFVLLEFIDRFPDHDDRYIPEVAVPILQIPEVLRHDPHQLALDILCPDKDHT